MSNDNSKTNAKSVSDYGSGSNGYNNAMCSYEMEDFKRMIEEKDILIGTLQDRIKLLLGVSQIQMNLFSNDIAVKDIKYLDFT